MSFTIAFHPIPDAFSTAAGGEVDAPEFSGDRIVVPLAGALFTESKPTNQLKDLGDRRAGKEAVEGNDLWTPFAKSVLTSAIDFRDLSEKCIGDVASAPKAVTARHDQRKVSIHAEWGGRDGGAQVDKWYCVAQGETVELVARMHSVDTGHHSICLAKSLQRVFGWERLRNG